MIMSFVREGSGHGKYSRRRSPLRTMCDVLGIFDAAAHRQQHALMTFIAVSVAVVIGTAAAVIIVKGGKPTGGNGCRYRCDTSLCDSRNGDCDWPHPGIRSSVPHPGRPGSGGDILDSSVAYLVRTYPLIFGSQLHLWIGSMIHCLRRHRDWGQPLEAIPNDHLPLTISWDRVWCDTGHHCLSRRVRVLNPALHLFQSPYRRGSLLAAPVVQPWISCCIFCLVAFSDGSSVVGVVACGRKESEGE